MWCKWESNDERGRRTVIHHSFVNFLWLTLFACAYFQFCAFYSFPSILMINLINLNLFSISFLLTIVSVFTTSDGIQRWLWKSSIIESNLVTSRRCEELNDAEANRRRRRHHVIYNLERYWSIELNHKNYILIYD